MTTTEKLLPATILEPQWSVQQQIALAKQIEEYVAAALVEGAEHDYGVLPGTKKKVLFKPGAEKLLAYFGLWADPHVDEKNEDWSANPPFFDYTVSAVIKRKRDDQVQAKAVRSCNSYETKYKYRYQDATCPDCKAQLFKSKQKPEYFCWAKKGGCGAVFALDSDEILKPGKVINPDIADCKDTVLAMAEKRAIVAATIRATFCSWLFAPDAPPGQHIVDADTGEVTDVQSKPIVKPDDDAPICSPKQRAEFLEDLAQYGYSKKEVVQMILDRWPGVFDAKNLENSLNAKFLVSMKDELLKDIKHEAEQQHLNEQFANQMANEEG